MFLNVNSGMGATPARRRPRLFVMPSRRGLGAYATGICEGGKDTGDGSPCTPAVPGAQGGISTEALASMNASLNPGVAKITVADIIANGLAQQQIAAAVGQPSAPPAVVTPPPAYTQPPPSYYSQPVAPPAPPSLPSSSAALTSFGLTNQIAGIPIWAIGAGVLGLVLLLPMMGGKR
jgi:hypothetical protein